MSDENVVEMLQVMEQGVIERMIQAGWIRKAIVLDSKGARSFEWTALGIQRSREIHSALVELGFRDGGSVRYRRGEYDILMDFTGDCISHYGLE